MSASPLSILIIDDCEGDRKMLVRYLKQMPQQTFYLIQTDSAIEGWELCQKEKVDCILIDYLLPELNGLEFIESLKRDDGKRFLPVLMLTGQGDEAVASNAMKCGANDYLVKNKLTAEGLLRAVTRAVEKGHLLQENDRQRCEIERSYQELEQFAHTVSHDLQAPARRIMKFSELLQDELGEALNGRSQDYVNRIVKSAAHMQNLIKNLLEYSLLDGNKGGSQAVKLDDVLKQVLSQLEVMISNSNSKIEVRALPVVMGNPVLLYQLFQNLISNAIKFQGKDSPHIEISARDTDSNWVITIKDNGAGIPIESFDSIFGIFQRLDNGNQVEGTGIGLAVCKKIVELHDGRIWVDSIVNEGTAFHFTLPPIRDHMKNENSDFCSTNNSAGKKWKARQGAKFASTWS